MIQSPSAEPLYELTYETKDLKKKKKDEKDKKNKTAKNLEFKLLLRKYKKLSDFRTSNRIFLAFFLKRKSDKILPLGCKISTRCGLQDACELIL